MAETARRQRDLFESPPMPTSIPIDVEQQMLELLKELLTEALAGGAAEAHHVDEEDGSDQDHV